jgi:hypothetical protein
MKNKALEYYDKFNFNVTRMLSEKNMFNAGHNIFKHPGHNWDYLSYERQSRNDLTGSNWNNVTGIGAVLGYNNLRALDIDSCNDINFVLQLLDILNLPNKYRWTIRSGSKNGFHILFVCEDENTKLSDPIRIAFSSNKYHKRFFKKIEFRWEKHIVLPPSVHESGYEYEFLFGEPSEIPINVEIDKLKLIIDQYCISKNENNTLKPTRTEFLKLKSSSSSEDDYSSSSEDDFSSSSEDDYSSSSEDDFSSSSEDDFSSSEDDFSNDYEDGPSYDKYGGYNGYDDDTIDSAFDGDPMNTWNVD